MPGRRKESAAQSALAADAVLAYVRDEEPDVLNITDAAVAADPLVAALHLTAFAGRAIRRLAESLGVPAEAAVALVRDRDRARMADKVLRMSYDPVADAGYIYVVDPIASGDVASTSVLDHPLDRASVNVNFDADNLLLGIELLGVSRLLRG